MLFALLPSVSPYIVISGAEYIYASAIFCDYFYFGDFLPVILYFSADISDVDNLFGQLSLLAILFGIKGI